MGNLSIPFTVAARYLILRIGKHLSFAAPGMQAQQKIDFGIHFILFFAPLKNSGRLVTHVGLGTDLQCGNDFSI